MTFVTLPTSIARPFVAALRTVRLTLNPPEEASTARTWIVVL